MPYFDRFDIVEAHYWYCVNYHDGQASALYARLCRIRRYFAPGHGHVGPSTANGREIYTALVSTNDNNISRLEY